MNYTINNNFCDRDEATSIIHFCIEKGEVFSYNKNEVWDCRRIYDVEFKQTIIDKLTSKFKNDEFNLWFDYNKFNLKNCSISLTAYYNNRYLNLHKDTTSELTTVIVLSDGYEGGEFALSEEDSPSFHFEKMDGISTFDLKLGDSISFNGSTTYHGVLPITSGIRYALNIWMTESDYDYPKIKTNKTLV
jgi:hypothetical protein